MDLVIPLTKVDVVLSQTQAMVGAWLGVVVPDVEFKEDISTYYYLN